MESPTVIETQAVSKYYRIWENPAARLKWGLLKSGSSLLPRTRGIQDVFSRKMQRYYRDFFALQDVSLKVKRGESVGIMGRNGSGKSTLLQIIAGTLQPTTGNAVTHGKIGALLELGSGFNPEFTGRENVFLNAALLGFSRAETEAHFAEIEQFADIGEFIDQPVKTYSSGMVVRLAFSVQTVVHPEILIVDEALAVGDESFQRKCFRRLQDLKDDGTSLLFVSHAAAQVVELCDRALLLVKGRVSCEGRPKDVVNEYHRQIYGGDQAGRESPQRRRAAAKADRKTTHWQMAADNRPSPADEAYWAELPPNSALHAYDACGAELSPPWIETAGGEKVNHLTRGITYFYCYDVSFQATLRGVRFGAAIKTPTGLELAGMTSHRGTERIPEVAAGTRARLRFAFRCRLLPGAYFLNAGVLAVDGEGKEYFCHRLVDACMFKVNYEPDLPVNATIDLLEFAEIDVIPAGDDHPSS